MIDKAAYCVLKIDVDGMYECDKAEYSQELGTMVVGTRHPLVISYLLAPNASTDFFDKFVFKW